MSIPLIGLTGKIGSGKDTVFDRLELLYPDVFVQASFAAKLKQSVAALFDVTLEQLEEWKRDDLVFVKIEDMRALGGTINGEHICDGQLVAPPMTFRTVLQRAGTEMGRNIFGENFWVDQTMDSLYALGENYYGDGSKRFYSDSGRTIVFTDVRFPNEAQAIRERGGEIWEIIGPDEDTGDHPSEAGVGLSLIDRTVDNRQRDDEFSMLDSKLRQIVDTWSYVS